MEEKRNISVRKIKLSLVCELNDKSEIKKYTNEVYDYLRKSIKAQNEAFNILTSEIYFAKKLGKNEANIYYQYSHQAPLKTDTNEKQLLEILEMCPVTQEKIDEKIKNYREFRMSKKKPPKEETLNKACEKIEKKLKKYIGVSKEDIQKEIDMLENYCAYPKYVYENFANGLSTPAYVAQQVKEYFKSFGSDVIFDKVAVRNMKDDNPLILPPNIFYRDKQLVGLVHEYDSYKDFLDNLHSNRDFEVYFYLPGKKGENKIKFKLIFGNPNKSNELRCVIQNIIEGTYKIRVSKIGFTMNKKTKKNTDLTLFLTYDMPVQEFTLDENTVVGVDLGQAIPAVCALNNNPYVRKYIGSSDDFLKIRTQMQSRRRDLQKALTISKGGRGRKKKLQALDKLRDKESNFVDTYCHMVSKKVVDFALKHRAKYINLECLKGFGCDKKILRNWSYYKLQADIEYKAKRYGIIVRKINPCFTSQVCSECGHWEEGQRITQKKFICAKPECKFHNLKRGYINADFNAARNIAKSTLWLEDEVTEKQIKEAAQYYNIPYEKGEV